MTDAGAGGDSVPRRRTTSASRKRATGESSIYRDEDGRWQGYDDTRQRPCCWPRGRPRVVVEVLGHAPMRTTTDTYSHVMPALGRDAADRMGRALWD